MLTESFAQKLDSNSREREGTDTSKNYCIKFSAMHDEQGQQLPLGLNGFPSCQFLTDCNENLNSLIGY
jgi:hypothetical protein